jgi:uncharacterized membrane protein YdjX (TVP38/TMEM64 family)
LKLFFTREIIGGFLGVLLVVLLFVFTSYIVKEYEENIRFVVESKGTLGMVYYILLTAGAIVVAPISTLPLIPVASMVWGWFIAAILSIIGWVLGSQIAFFFARRYGKPLIQKIVSLKKLEQFEKRLPQKNMFWSIVFLRMIVPVDILSYAVGLFSEIKSTTYFWATLLGVIPFAFMFSYTGTLSFGTQVIICVEVALLVFIVYLFKNKKI